MEKSERFTQIDIYNITKGGKEMKKFLSLILVMLFAIILFGADGFTKSSYVPRDGKTIEFACEYSGKSPNATLYSSKFYFAFDEDYTFIPYQYYADATGDSAHYTIELLGSLFEGLPVAEWNIIDTLASAITDTSVDTDSMSTLFAYPYSSLMLRVTGDSSKVSANSQVLNLNFYPYKE